MVVDYEASSSEIDTMLFGSQVPVPVHQTTWRYIPGGSNVMAALCVQNVMKLATVSQEVLQRGRPHSSDTRGQKVNKSYIKNRITGLITAVKSLDIVAVMIIYSYQNMHIQQSNQTQIELNFNSSQILIVAFPSQCL